MTRTSKLMALLTAVSLTAPLAVSAQQRPQPPAMPTAKIAMALGVSEQAVVSCFPAQPAKGERPKAQPERPDAGKIATCLRTENTGLTAASVEKVLQDLAPASPRKRG